ncbi:MAG: polymorphic toxin-type HINT domain-containing protein [Thermogemmata sp.]|nr:polymorphic toxin-type HINT domain-containing protein [Thermogemmata sp.]
MGWVRWEALTTTDAVLCLPEDEQQGELAYRPVEKVFRRWDMIWEVLVAGEVLRTTAEHPLWVRGWGWTAGKDLQVGDALRPHDGQWLAVEGVQDTGREEVVYNRRVAEYHSYFVGDGEWDWSVWTCSSYAPATSLTRNATEVGGFAIWITAEEIIVINRQFAGVTTLTRKVARDLGLVNIPPNWNGCDDVWSVLGEMANNGSTVVIKIDGERMRPEDNGRYTVVVSGGPLGGDFFRVDTTTLEEGLAKAIIYYARKCWGKGPQRLSRSEA